MFYGLTNYIKKFLPKRLFYRSLIIVATPIILLQIIITVVFFDSLWIKANKGMTRSLVSEIRTLYDVYRNPDMGQKQTIINLYNKNFEFAISYKQNEFLPAEIKERWYSPVDRSLRRELKSVFNDTYWFDSTKYKEVVDLRIKYLDGILQIFFPKHKISPSSARIFALWITLPGFLLITIAIVFLKNQTRPIINLAIAAERFGKGEFVKEFRPSGAQEIRQAAYEFDKMRKRISVHLNQRSEMLSGISHDLRTPLTRLKLQLALLKQQDLAKKMSEDIEEMERMLNEYLEFSRHQKNEETESINLKSLIEDIIKKYPNKKIDVKFSESIEVNGRPNAIKRSLINIIDNGLSYGKKIEISLAKKINDMVIIIDDDGPGIPEKEYKNVMKPFYRIDKSRGLNKSGVGLGLSITNDIIHAHGGNISLEKSLLNGLRVKISLPL
ncbi:MAG: two-component system, OmpR family, osmolarity sensor histidine kinase EnvZ [Pelagibacterales bacterium]|nr:two-component system, OmpR family, osmolarity sensor histidine kinase EnvZ [Pelagibacterales bacterium]